MSMARPRESSPAARSASGAAPLPQTESPIVPKQSIGGRALVAVVAIMTFLASLVTGSVMILRANASEWQAEVLREVTIQIRPATGRDLEAEVRKATEIAGSFKGVSNIRSFSKEESKQLLEPWLGAGLVVDDLPVPRVLIVKLVPGASPDIAGLRRALTEKVGGVSLDDHRGWIDRMHAIADSAVIAGIVVFALMMIATVLSVSFATRGAMEANRPIIEVLHFIGATDGFVAGQFQRHFLWLGLKGGLIGGAIALAVFALIRPMEALLGGTSGAEQLAALFGSITLGLQGYIVVVVQILVIAAIAAWASRRTVHQTLSAI